MTTTTALLLASSSLYCGFQWTIRVLVYPQFADVPAEGFVGYERRHQQRVSIAVGPLFVLFGVSAVAAFAVRPDLATAVPGGCLVLILLITALGAVPQHRRLSAGFDPEAHRRLLAADSARLAFAVLAVVASVVDVVT